MISALTALRSMLIAIITLMIAACSASAPTADSSPSESPSSSAVDRDEPESDRNYTVTFRDRTIDLFPYVQGFPYSGFMPQIEHGFMLYFEDTPQGKWLMYLALEPGEDIDLTEGQRLHDIDWSTRSFRRGIFNPFLERFIFLGDEKNDEVFNLYALDVDNGELEALTDVDYIYGYGFSDDDRQMGVVVRRGDSEPFDSCLYIHELHTGEKRQIWCDGGGDDRLTWTAIDFSPDGDTVLVRMQHDGNRNTTNIASFPTDEPASPQFLLERGTEHLSLWPIGDTFDGESFLYVSSQRGINDVYRYQVPTQDSERLTELSRDIRGAAWLEQEGKPPLLLLLLQLPYGTIIELRDPGDGTVLWTATRDETLSIVDHHGAETVFAMSSVRTPFEMKRGRLHHPKSFEHRGERPSDRPLSLTISDMAAPPQELIDELVQCEVERVEFTTFDETDGNRRKLHAYLYEPRDPPPQSMRLARVTAFYGGGNFFRTTHQIMCEAGITTLSPSPRGSRGFGADFAALNDGDLGGDDIIDLFYAARWLEVERNLKPWQIGVYGASHGGYAAMRALTFPPETNDRDESYPFGFGLSHAGISDLMHFYETSNIPDWLVLLAGDPDTEPERLRQRSPLHHVHRLEAPLLLTHGSQDSRVPVDESRRFARAAEEYGLPVVYEEFEGQGHGIDGLNNRMRYFRAVFEFLETQVDPRLSDRADGTDSKATQ